MIFEATDVGLTLVLTLARYIVLSLPVLPKSGLNMYAVIAILSAALAYAVSRDVKVSVFVALVAVLARAVYRYANPDAGTKWKSPKTTLAFAAGTLGVLSLARNSGPWVNWGLYCVGFYYLASLTEYLIHKYVMHCYSFAPWILKNPFGSIRRICTTHWRHHRSVESDMSLNSVADEHELVFDWGLTLKLGLGVGMIMWVVSQAARLRVPLKTHLIVTAIMVVGFSVMWNTVHPSMHNHELSSDIFMPPALPYKLRGGLLYDNHAIHHLVKGERKGNFNVVYLGADEVFAQNRLSD